MYAVKNILHANLLYTIHYMRIWESVTCVYAVISSGQEYTLKHYANGLPHKTCYEK